MLIKLNKNYSIKNFLFCLGLFLPIVFCVSIINGQAQSPVAKKVSANVDLPVWQGYKGVGIGMTADEVIAKLGSPKSQDATDIFYVFSDAETVQILLDNQKKVRNISAMFSAEFKNQPKFEEVFGKGVAAEPKPDGSIFKMVKYTGAGYSVSYSRTAGEAALVIVMLQKF